MKQEIKENWVQALKNYSLNPSNGMAKTVYHSSLKSIGGQLSPDRILCDLYLKSKGLEWGNKNKLDCHGTTHAIPKEVLEWSGLKTHDPILKSAPKTFLFDDSYSPTLCIVSALAKKKFGEVYIRISYEDIANLIQSDL